MPDLTATQRDTLTLVHWDDTAKVWQPSTVAPKWSGNKMSAQLTEFSFWDWITGTGQTVGENTGSRSKPPTCSGALPPWIKGTVSPSEDLSAAAIQVCFAPDKADVATVRVANNRTFTQVMTMSQGSQAWAWRWPGQADYSVVGVIYLMAHQVFDTGTSYLLPPLQEEACEFAR